jgi:hypothetical protein
MTLSVSEFLESIFLMTVNDRTCPKEIDKVTTWTLPRYELSTYNLFY